MVRKTEYCYRISKSFRLSWTRGEGTDNRYFKFCYMWKVKDRRCLNNYFSMHEFHTKKQLEDYLDSSEYWRENARHVILCKE